MKYAIRRALMSILEKFDRRLRLSQEPFFKTIPQIVLPKLEFHIEDSCNLNCVGCNHFSPLAKRHPADYDKLRKDLGRVAELFNGKIGVISILGGEPLLNQEIVKYMELARELFPYNYIRIVTNGVLFEKMKDDFWQACIKYDIAIACTTYPVRFDYSKWEKIITGKGIKYESMSDGVKDMVIYPIDPYGRQDVNINFYQLCTSNKCTFLKDGKIYPCAYAPNIDHFNSFFNKKIPLDEKDGIDIYKVNSADEIFDFLSRPIPFCRFCKRKNNKTVKWRVSARDIEEWYDTTNNWK